MEGWIAERLLTGSIQGAVVIGLAWFACRRFPAIPAPVQAGLWWLASLKLVLAFAPIPGVALPLLPPLELTETAGMVADVMPPTAVPRTSPWLAIVAVLWGGGVLVQAGLLWKAFRRLRKLIGRSTPLPSSDAAVASAAAMAAGLPHLPPVRLSADITAPLVAGAWRPVVLVPAALPGADRAMALCHEFMHLRRHDLVLGWVPALAERLFFFHPLARLAAREYVTAREAACDAAVVRALGVPAADYGRLLVRLGVARQQPVPAAGGAPGSIASLRRRLDMLQHPALDGRPRHLWWLVAAALVLAVVPFEVSARQARPRPVAPLELRPVARAAQAPAAPAQVARPVVPAAPAAPAPERNARPVEAAPPVSSVEAISPGLNAPESSTSTVESSTVLNAMQERADQIRRLEEAGADIQRTVEAFNTLAEQANRLVRQPEQQIELRQLLDVALVQKQNSDLARDFARLRAEQQQLMEWMQDVAKQQQELAELQRQLLREAERIGNKLQSR